MGCSQRFDQDVAATLLAETRRTNELLLMMMEKMVEANTVRVISVSDA